MPEPNEPNEPTPPKVAINLRETLARYGADAMTNTQLLALALNNEPAAKALLIRYGAEELPSFPLARWMTQGGIGAATGARMAATFALASRLLTKPDKEFRVGSPREAYDLLRDMKRQHKERLVALYLDAQNYLIARETISVGSLNTTRTHPREILRPAIQHNALSFVLAHNHPSGSLEPSRDDLDFTRSIARAADLMGITLADHLIVSPKGYTSLKERGGI